MIKAFGTGRSWGTVTAYAAIALIGALLLLNHLKILYEWLSALLVLGVYIWGVGNGSRTKPHLGSEDVAPISNTTDQSIKEQ